MAELERKLAESPARTVAPTRDWRSVAGMFEGSEFMRQVDAEVAALREAERRAAMDVEPE